MRRLMNRVPVTLAVGLLFLLLGTLICLNRVGDFRKGEAEIVRIEEVWDTTDNRTTQKVYVSYWANGNRYNDVELGSYHSGMKVGDTVSMEYDVKNPEHLRTNGDFLFIILAFGVGGVLTAYSVLPQFRKKE